MPPWVTSVTALISIIWSAALSSAITSDLTFLSGVADTVQDFSIRQQNGDTSAGNAFDRGHVIKRHHLVCLHKGSFHQYNKIYNTSPEKCCNDLWSKGLIETKQYCMDRMALLPDVQSPALMMSSILPGLNIARGDVRPIHYLAIDEELEHKVAQSMSTNTNYKQRRDILAQNELNQRENVRDLPGNGVISYSPFHIMNFMPEGRDALEISRAVNGKDNIVSLMDGRVNGTLSAESGMHRAFHQTVILSTGGMQHLSHQPSTKMEQYLIEINATVFLPLMESVFIDADDPFITEYNSGSFEPILCQISITSNKNAAPDSKCSIEFISSETIDIEQPSFASRQNVVAFQINAAIELSSSVFSDILLSPLQVAYGNTLHIRYLPPITNQLGNISSAFDGFNGFVPIAIGQPILYSASMQVIGSEKGNTIQYFVLDTDPAIENQNSSRIHELIVINVAAGIDQGYWIVTAITMLSALIGGFVIMASIDSVSIWE